MPVTKNAAFRYRIIDACLRNRQRRFPDMALIQEKVSEGLNLGNVISKSSLNKDLKAMRDFYKAPICYSKPERGYYYDDPDFSINSFPLNQDEMHVLDLSSAFLKQIKHSGFFQHFEATIDRLISGFRISKMPGYENRKILETEEPMCNTGINWLEQLYVAIINATPLRVTYRRFNADQETVHPFSPYVIREYRNRWYATGYSERAKAIATLALDRILDVQPLNQPYMESPDFDVAAYFKYSFGATVLANSTPHKVQLLFHKLVAGYILTNPLHASQTILDHQNDLLIEMECFLTQELEMTILSYGENVKVVAPYELVEKIKKRIEAISYLYR